jgi:hypothetical protein
MKEALVDFVQHYLNLTEFEAEEVLSSMETNDEVELQFENKFFEISFDGYNYTLKFKEGLASKSFEHYCDLINFIFNYVDRMTGKSNYIMNDIF